MSEERSSKDRELDKLRRILAELASRKMDGLLLYLALPSVEDFHACRHKFRILDGSNRAGKTLAAAAEIARAIRALDPFDKFVKQNGNLIVLGLNYDHIGRMWQKCYEEGQFKIIRDEHTHLWRAVRPSQDDPTTLDPYDEAYQEKWKDAPPLIPESEISRTNIAWENSSKRQPRFAVCARTGCRINFFSSEAEAARGDHYTGAWIDEQVQHDSWISEIKRGLVAVNEPRHHAPKLIWSATPQDCHPALLEMREQSDKASAHYKAFSLSIFSNPYIPAEEKQAFIEGLPAEEVDTRAYGKYAVYSRLIYPLFDPMGIHGIEYDDVPISQCTHFCSIDPGTRIAGVTFHCVDADEKHSYCYDGFETRKRDPHDLARRIKDREQENGVRFEAIVFDKKAGSQQGIAQGCGETTASFYWNALQEAGVEPRIKGPMEGFFPGISDTSHRQQALNDLLHVRQGGPFVGTPKFLIARGRIPELEMQIKRIYIDPRTEKRVDDKKFVQDVLDSCEYFAGFGGYYREPEPAESVEVSPTAKAWENKRKRRRAKTYSSI